MLGHMKLGKREPKHDPRTLRLARYLPTRLPEPPVFRDWSNGHSDWGMMKNNDLGDCTIAGCGHLVQLWTQNTSSRVTISDAEIVSYYEKWAGYDPSNPSTDAGAYELEVLNKWRKQGLSGHELLAYAAVNPLDARHVKQAICLFGGLYLGLSLPLSATYTDPWVITDKESEPGSWGGHCVVICGYDLDYITCITWGQLKRMTWSFFGKYCEEAYALLSQDWLAHFGNGVLDQQALMNDLQAVT
jgi:hypothetical protein